MAEEVEVENCKFTKIDKVSDLDLDLGSASACAIHIGLPACPTMQP